MVGGQVESGEGYFFALLIKIYMVSSFLKKLWDFFIFFVFHILLGQSHTCDGLSESVCPTNFIQWYKI